MRGERILVIGGGAAGLEIATLLGDRFGRKGQLDLTLVDSNTAHVWKPMLHTIAAGTSDTSREQVPYISHARQHHFRYAPGSLLSLDRTRRIVRVSPFRGEDGDPIFDERELLYDVLVIAVGSRANDFGTPGVAERCHIIDTRREADAVNRKVREAVVRCAVLSREMRIAIVGGTTGVELAAELVQLLEAGSAYGDIDLRGRVGIVLLDSGKRLLGGFSKKGSAAATRQLAALGVEIRNEVRVAEAAAHGFVLTDGTLVPASVCVWAAGVKGAVPEANALDGLALSRNNQIVVRPSLQAEGDDTIFALGDCVSLTLPGADRPLPPTTQVAHQQAQHFVRHLPAFLEGRPIPEFRFRDLGSLGTSGGSSAAFIEGNLAKLGHQFPYRSHQARLHGFWRGTAIWSIDRLSRFVSSGVRVD